MRSNLLNLRWMSSEYLIRFLFDFSYLDHRSYRNYKPLSMPKYPPLAQFDPLQARQWMLDAGDIHISPENLFRKCSDLDSCRMNHAIVYIILLLTYTRVVVHRNRSYFRPSSQYLILSKACFGCFIR